MYPLLWKSNAQKSCVYSLIFSSLRYSAIMSLQGELINTNDNNYLKVMEPISLDQFLDDGFEMSNKPKGPEEIGLFTFYRQQQEREHERKLLRKNKSKKDEQKKFKHRRIMPEKGENSISMAPKEETADTDTLNQSCQSFLKNVNIKAFKTRFDFVREISCSQNMKKRQQTLQQAPKLDDVLQDRQDVALQDNELARSCQQSHCESTEPLVRLKRFEELLREQKKETPAEMHFKRHKASPRKLGRLTLKIRTQPDQEQSQPKIAAAIIPQIQPIQERQNYIRRKSLQETFLQKLRMRENSSQSKNKSPVRSNPIDSINSVNQRFISSLLNNFELPQHCQNQAAKMLRETLKFPNLMFIREPFKQQSNSPSRYAVRINNERNSLSWRKRSESKNEMVIEGQESTFGRGQEKPKRILRQDKFHNKSLKRQQSRGGYLTKSLFGG